MGDAFHLLMMVSMFTEYIQEKQIFLIKGFSSDPRIKDLVKIT
tara:strand:- start:28648 stop:28776 length:129 start_codon:yes stop_codon:yes gene_type:complete